MCKIADRQEAAGAKGWKERSPESKGLGSCREGAGAEAAEVMPSVRAKPAHPFTPPAACAPPAAEAAGVGAESNPPTHTASMTAKGLEACPAPLPLNACMPDTCHWRQKLLAEDRISFMHHKHMHHATTEITFLVIFLKLHEASENWHECSSSSGLDVAHSTCVRESRGLLPGWPPWACRGR